MFYLLFITGKSNLTFMPYIIATFLVLAAILVFAIIVQQVKSGLARK